MKMLSDNAVTKADLESAQSQLETTIGNLRVGLVLSFVVNVILSLGVYFVTR